MFSTHKRGDATANDVERRLKKLEARIQRIEGQVAMCVSKCQAMQSGGGDGRLLPAPAVQRVATPLHSPDHRLFASGLPVPDALKNAIHTVDLEGCKQSYAKVMRSHA